MKRSSKSRCPAAVPRRPACYRPQLLALEDRLPLGDALWGAVLGSWLLGPALPFWTQLLRYPGAPAPRGGRQTTGSRQPVS